MSASAQWSVPTPMPTGRRSVAPSLARSSGGTWGMKSRYMASLAADASPLFASGAAIFLALVT